MFRSTVYSCTASIGDPCDYETMIKLYRSTDLDEEKNRLMRAGMANFENRELLKKTLEFAISADVRAQDSVFLIAGVARNRLGRDISLEFFKEHLNLFKGRYQSGSLLAKLVKSVSERFLTEEKAQMVEKFFQENPLPGSERNVSQSLETIRLNSSWLQRDGAAINSFLSSTQ